MVKVGNLQTGYKYGFIDKTGREIISCKYDQARAFSEGLAVVKLNSNYMLIDKTGNEITLPQKYTNVYDVSEGMVGVDAGTWQDTWWESKHGFISINKSSVSEPGGSTSGNGNKDGSGSVSQPSAPSEQAQNTVPVTNDELSLTSVDSSKFTDVSSSDWFYNDVMYVYEKGLFKGTSEAVFSPNASMTRAMLVTVLWRMADEPDVELIHGRFIDVGQNQYYETAVAWAAKSNIISGYSEEIFGPNDPITREQLATILYRYADEPTLEVGGLEFTDAGKVSEWASDAFIWATHKGIINGKTGNLLDPQATATRTEVAAMLHRFLILMEI